jgi:hypothetical protein
MIMAELGNLLIGANEKLSKALYPNFDLKADTTAKNPADTAKVAATTPAKLIH